VTAFAGDPPYRVARAVPGQLPALAAIERAAGERFEAADLPRELARKTTPHAVLASACEDGRLWVALASERPVGFAFVGVVDGRAHLAEMSVHPDHERRGLGSQLLEHALDWRGAPERPGTTLTTFDHVPWNRPFYERRGFVRLDAVEPGSELAKILAGEERSGLRRRIAMIHRERRRA
jgi:GNAT superfamily N-acetyltransferase